MNKSNDDENVRLNKESSEIEEDLALSQDEVQTKDNPVKGLKREIMELKAWLAEHAEQPDPLEIAALKTTTGKQHLPPTPPATPPPADNAISSTWYHSHLRTKHA